VGEIRFTGGFVVGLGSSNKHAANLLPEKQGVKPFFVRKILNIMALQNENKNTKNLNIYNQFVTKYRNLKSLISTGFELKMG
jgi:hypothetical protein